MAVSSEEKSENLTSHQKWLDAIQQAGKGKVASWENRGEKIVNRYRDERDDTDDRKKYNVLWSNVQTLKPALFGNTPKPNVARRFNQKDPVGKQAALVLEKALSVHWDDEELNNLVDDCVDDYLLPGRGQLWAKYVPTMTTETVGEETIEEVVFEEAQLEYVYWKDFRHGQARRWKDVPWVARRTFPDRQELTKRWPGKDVPCNHKDEDDKKSNKAVVWEIWDKKSGKQIFLAEGMTEILDEGAVPLSFKDFFPCPAPLLATTTTDSLIPVPDYVQYQDQADELDSLSNRIDLLLDALAVRGVYDGSHTGLEKLLANTDENTLIPVDNWAMYAERGGLTGAIDWLPIEQVVNVLVRLYEAREATKQELYEVTGLSDILRGSTDPNETAKAQGIKAQFGSLRLDDRRKAVARFIKQAICLQAEIIAEQFEPQTLELMTGEQVDEQVMALLRNGAIRTFSIDIETDSTIKMDQEKERADRMEFLNNATAFMEKAVVIGQQSPALTPLMGEMLMFAVRGFKVGRELEETLDSTLEQLQQSDQPDPMEERMAALESAMREAELQKTQADTDETRAKTAETVAKVAETHAQTEGQLIENELRVIE